LACIYDPVWRLACAMILAVPAVASAAAVSWTAPASCPDQAALREAIVRRLGAPLDSIALIVDIKVELDVDGYVARLDFGDASEESRVITSVDCAELTDAVALVIARLAVAAARNVSAPKVVEAPPSRTTPEPGWNGGVRVAGLFGTGASPGIGIAGDVGGWFAWRSYAVAVSASQWSKGTVTLDGTMSGVDIDVRAFSLRTGWRPRTLPLRSWLIARWGQIRGEAVGLDDGRGGTARWTAAGIGAGWAFALTSRVAVVPAAEAEMVLDRATFSLDSGTELYRTPPMALHGSVAIEVGWR
jgi:hypothetical protein